MSETSPAGILPCQTLEALIAQAAITAARPFDADQVQPASLDLRLGRRAWRVRASFLPRPGRTVADRLADVVMHEIDLSAGAVLERGCVYIAELQEALALPTGISARANPKSSTGRLDVFVRLLTDHQPAFDDVVDGYRGPAFIEIAPQTFSVLVRAGTRLNQLRLKRGEPPRLSTVSIGVDLESEAIAGFRARRHAYHHPDRRPPHPHRGLHPRPPCTLRALGQRSLSPRHRLRRRPHPYCSHRFRRLHTFGSHPRRLHRRP